MPFVKYLPMLAKPLPLGFDPRMPHSYFAEQKYDGHRMLVCIDHREATQLSSWSRTGVNSERKLSAAMRKALLLLPDGVYDGELALPVGDGSQSSDVSKLENQSRLVYYLFDILELDGTPTMHLPYTRRRLMLAQLVLSPPIFLAPSWEVESLQHLDSLAEQVWAQHGEGLIIKSAEGKYYPGKRSDSFMKVKKCETAVLTIVGFKPSEGEINNRGPYGMTVLCDDEGNETAVKTLDDATLREAEALGSIPSEGSTRHPWVGRKLRIEYHVRTSDGSYRHGRWDRFEDE